MSTRTEWDAETEDDARPSVWIDRSPKWAVGLFVLVTVGAAAFYLYMTRYRWFFADDWDYLVVRNLGVPASLLRPHNEHLQLLPIVVERLTFGIFKLDSYLPYQIPVIILHLGVSWLIWAHIKRAGVGAWIATAGATTFLLLGSALGNIIFASQLTMVGALSFGLLQLLLANHDGPWQRRDYWALVAGFTAMLCSNVSVTMIAVTGLTMLLRRGWKTAVLQTVPLAAVFLLWSAFYGTSKFRPGSAADLAEFIWRGMRGAFNSLSQIPWGGVLLVIVLLAGLTLVVLSHGWSVFRGRLAAPAAMFLGGVGSYLAAGIGRAGPYGPESAAGSRFSGVAIALIIPLLAVAVDAICRRNTAVGILALVVLVAGIPQNIDKAFSSARAEQKQITKVRELIMALPVNPLAADAPDDLRPLPEDAYATEVTMGFLKEGLRDGWLPQSAGIDRKTELAATFRLSLYQRVDAGPGPGPCTPIVEPLDIRAEAGDQIHIGGGFVSFTETTVKGALKGQRITYNPNRGTTVAVLSGPLSLRLTGTGVNGAGQFCGIGN
ncbi:hypothetical protein D1871_21905 [Nakamurella silvestris]|nr:hypothetical protein D1871_21905 [Nakamurella silvestris]